MNTKSSKIPYKRILEIQTSQISRVYTKIKILKKKRFSNSTIPKKPVKPVFEFSQKYK